MKISVLKCDKAEFGKDVLYKCICSVKGPEFVKDDDTVIVYSVDPLVPLSDYEVKIKVAKDMKSLKFAIGKQVNPAKM